MSATLKSRLIRRWSLLRARVRFDFQELSIRVPDGVLNPTLMRSSLFFAEQCQAVAEERGEASGPPAVLELGCGCGLASLVFAQQGARVTALDCDLAAVVATAENAHRNGCSVNVMVSDWDSALRVDQRFDVVLLNPPFLKEPVHQEADQWLQQALFSGADHEALQKALGAARRRLLATGCAILLTSERSGEDEVQRLIERANLRRVERANRKIQGERFFVHTLCPVKAVLPESSSSPTALNRAVQLRPARSLGTVGA